MSHSQLRTDKWAAREGVPEPLGVTWIPTEQAFNFTLYSRHATSVTLLLYSQHNLLKPSKEIPLNHLIHKSGRVWHCRLSQTEIGDAVYYAYKVDGVYAPELGQRFDPDKILLDPYARYIHYPKTFDYSSSRGIGSNAGRAPLGQLIKQLPPFDWGDDKRPFHTHDAVIYEMHVRGFTKHPTSGVSAEKRGTFAGVIEKIPYLKELGVTILELLPVFAYVPEETGNYWGYMPLSFFAPHHAYAMNKEAPDQFNEFREMVKALHAADIEVILDVVYNHTVEGDETGPTFHLRGIDNSTYYLLEPNMAKYRNDSGTGNVLRSGHPAVRKLLLDSMRFWVNEMHIDGFRFDLASIFTRREDGTMDLKNPPVISDIMADPDLVHVRLIAEAWDIAAYLLGSKFPGASWMQWNGEFRDVLRSFLRGDEGYVPAVLRRLYGSDDLFPDEIDTAYHPYQSINYITSHDGFCLYDLVSYNQKRNWANGHYNVDGHNDNRSWNCGWEGDDGVPPDVVTLRRRQIKNFCVALFLANGTPMLMAGDEFINTQFGNNNPYNQDNATSWLDWERLTKNQEIFRFFKGMIAFRKAHPTLCRSRYWRNDVRWYGVTGDLDTSHHSHTVAFYLDGKTEQDDDLYVMMNAYSEPLTFVVQEGSSWEWRRVVDTALPSPDDLMERGTEPAILSLKYHVQPRSIVVLLRRHGDPRGYTG